ncbi:hypothetical protein E3N88_09038 [Mikania micrantha]|uniref:Uncharacterized protein n=1 Tax=Mikania micrantha TaxID=192012 RepID=A0A5N6PIJ7_9ASTR|nr:hypothetical protein E3N88_09038 [Mikania micrantha]
MPCWLLLEMMQSVDVMKYTDEDYEKHLIDHTHELQSQVDTQKEQMREEILKEVDQMREEIIEEREQMKEDRRAEMQQQMAQFFKQMSILGNYPRS